MRSFKVAVVVTAAAILGSSGVAVAAPKDYCADLKGGNTGSTCEIQCTVGVEHHADGIHLVDSAARHAGCGVHG